MKCPYCGKNAVWGDNSMIYGKNFGKSYKCYYCKYCDAYVGCHKNSRKALGTLANRELRQLRMETHKIFNPLWKDQKMIRKDAYKMLSDHFGYEVHIGQSNEQQCKAIIEFLQSNL